MKFIDAIKDKAFEIEYNNRVNAAVNTAVSALKDEFAETLKGEKEKSFNEGLEKGSVQTNSEKDIKEAYDKGAVEGVKSYKAKLSSKGISTKKVDKPSCLGKYPDKPNRKCRTCLYAQECRKKSKK